MTVRREVREFHGAPSGFEGAASEDGVLPCTIEDVDEALFKTFDVEIGFQTTARDGSQSSVPVIFATGERFALVKRRKPIRDKNGRVILPLITIRRTRISQDDSDITGRGVNQHTGDVVVKRRLDARDRDYQRLINKLATVGQPSVAVESEVSGTLQLRTSRQTGAASRDVDMSDGALLSPKIRDNVFEFIVIPQPQFYTASYEITFHAQYTQHVNAMLEKLMSSYLQQGRKLKIVSKKGYWFVAMFGDAVSPADNLEEFTEEERVTSVIITCDVRAYLIAGSRPDGKGRVGRRFVSAPQIAFETRLDVRDIVVDRHENADDPDRAFLLTDPDRLRVDRSPSARERNRGSTRREFVENPFRNKNESRFIRAVSFDPDVGEQVFRST